MNILYPNYTVYTIIPKLYSATDRKMDKTAQVPSRIVGYLDTTGGRVEGAGNRKGVGNEFKIQSKTRETANTKTLSEIPEE